MYICQLADQIVPQLRNLLEMIGALHISIQPAAFFDMGFTSSPDCAGESTAVGETLVKA
jgi:hypothetical protein